uniref:Putative ribonuclease H-like domain-containing protein n=1 Tax=Tanacetum cinerariifolium TaxID=118510 RepID=A0A699KBV9_TANCI|nr:putative ribonuclease H-like domain-containing protein [Tanacetum cinerariifolium]
MVANSTTEAGYIAASHCCRQVLWIQNQMMVYGYNFMPTKIHVDNESAICVIKNHVYHSKTKHIDIRHDFIRDSYEKRPIEMVKIHTDNNVTDLLTKAFNKQNLEDDTEKKKLKAYLDIVPEDEFVMEIKSLASKYPIIDWKTHVMTEHFMYYQIIRAYGNSKNYKIFSGMLDDFDRQDVMDLHKLVEERYITTSPEGYDLMLWGDLKTLFKPDEKNELWKNQHE